MYSALIGGLGCFLAPRAVWLACVGRLAFLVRVWLQTSCSGFGLPMHAQLLRLFVTPQCSI